MQDFKLPLSVMQLELDINKEVFIQVDKYIKKLEKRNSKH